MHGHQLVISSFLSLCLLSVGEPDSPVLLYSAMKVDGNSFYVPLKQVDDGGSPLLHFSIRYRQVRDSASLSLHAPISISYSSLVLSCPYCHPLVLLYALSLWSFRIKRGLSGKRCSCRPMLTLSPFKTCLLAQTINWKSQRSMLMAPLSRPCSTSPSQTRLVCGLSLLTQYTLAC